MYAKHIRGKNGCFQMETQKAPSNFFCKCCNFTSSKKSNYDRHIMTLKHKKEQTIGSKGACEKCGKSYATRAGLWKHTQSCSNTSMIQLISEQKEITQTLLKKQEDFQKNVLDQFKLIQQKQQQQLESKSQVINISIFLNESCKDAVNWMDFINDIELAEHKTLLENIQQGIKQLGVYKRPVHFLPQQTFYLKHKDVWEHDIYTIKDVLRNSNCRLQERQLQLLHNWEKEHPMWYMDEHETEMYTKRSLLGELTETSLSEFKL